MAAFSRKENALLGFNQPISAPQSPDIDFHDVFGGPPRRASIQDTRSIFGETKDSFELRSEDERISHRRHRWSGLSEKPVFGEEGGNRRRYASDDFFDDIFRGSDSPKDPVNLNSATKVLSPGRPISPRVSEPYPSSSLPAQISLPGKLTNHHKNKDGISNGLFAHSPLSRFSSQVQEESRNSVSSKSSLSREISLNSDESPSLKQSEQVKKDTNPKKDSTDSQIPSVGPQFHFSIYKWASKGAPLPFRASYKSKIKERFKLDRSVSASGRIACEGMTKESPMEISNKIDRENEYNVNSVQSNSSFEDLKAEKGEISEAIQEAPKSNSRTLRSILLGNDEAKKAEESKAKSTKKSSSREKLSTRDEERITPKNVEMEKDNGQGTPKSSQDIPAKNRAKGKIKEFVKMFDQENSDQSKLRENSFSRSFRWMERGKNRTPDEQNRPTPNIVEDLPRTSTAAATEKVANISSRSKDNSVSAAAPIPNGSEARDEHVADSCHEDIQIKELIHDEDELQQTGNSQEEIQDIDDKIRKWSQGKQGNIRSLLSTLQYVLWSESGWKPVPLVNIIEGNAVKRSYQKALLSLHPDKLQQKGATSHQKYIAEKVFDILQEAWTHFNLLGSV